MAAIVKAAVSLYPTVATGGVRSSEWLGDGPVDKHTLTRRLAITGVTAADTATATVLGFSNLYHVLNSFGATAGAFPSCINPVTGTLLIGAGPSNETVYLTVAGEVPVVATAT